MQRYNLTKWIIAGEDGYDGAELQIWRRSNVGQNNYTLVGSSVLSVSSNSFVGVYNYTPSTPLEFQKGDILGVYQRSGSARVKVYYQETTGPANYRHSVNTDPPLDIEVLTEPSLINQYDYPLVSVEISVPTSTTVSTLVFYTSVPTVLPYTMRRDTAISTSSLTVARQAETGIIVIAVPVALVVIIIIIMTVTLVIIFTWWRRSHKNTHSVQYPAVTTSDEIVELQQNECYMTTNNEKDKQQEYVLNC